MRLRKLTLQNWRNLEQVRLECRGRRQFLVGANGQGKTRVLEAAGFDLWENELGDGRVTRRADKVLRELGYGDDDVAPCLDGIFSLIHPDDAEGLRDALEGCTDLGLRRSGHGPRRRRADDKSALTPRGTRGPVPR